MASRRTGEFRYTTRHLAVEKGKRSFSSKDMPPLKACKQLLKPDDLESSKFSLIPKNSTKKSLDIKNSALKDVKSKYNCPKSREKVVIVSKKSSSVRVVKSGSQKCVKDVQRSVSVKKVSYSTSVILSSEEEEEDSDSEDDDEDDDDDDDDDSEADDDYVRKPKVSSKKKDTVIKRTTSKTKTSYSQSKKVDSTSSKKAKALKLLKEKEKEKLGNKKKSGISSRELRPRFPYSPTQEWPTARAHRMASLNALAKVHVLYENEGRAPGESEENSIHEILLDDDSSMSDGKLVSSSLPVKETKSVSIKDKEKDKLKEKEKKEKNEKDKTKEKIEKEKMREKNEKEKMKEKNEKEKMKEKNEKEKMKEKNEKEKMKEKNEKMKEKEKGKLEKEKAKEKTKDKPKEKQKEVKTSDTRKRKKGVETKPKIIKRRKRMHPCDIDIIDTRICKRMASLNAQAILAASYVQEKPVRRPRIKADGSVGQSVVQIKQEVLDLSDLETADSEKNKPPINILDISQESSSQGDLIIDNNNSSHSPNTIISKANVVGDSDKVKTSYNKNIEKDYSSVVSTTKEQLRTTSSTSNNITADALASTSVSEVGVTKYTKVTKVQINTTKEMEIKEERKAERKIERIVEKDDVAITRMYHYQSNSASQSYSVRMETTYKPNSRGVSSPVAGPQRSGPIPSPHVMGAVMPTRQSYYNYQNRPGTLASQSYPVSRGMQPVMGVNQHMTRQYGNSAFAMPQYGHAAPMSYPPHNEYSYYQPAGPMIQPSQDQYMIHKPVPYHPHPHAQLQQAQPQQAQPHSPSSSNCDRYSMGNNTFSTHPSTSSLKPKHIPVPSTKHSDSSRMMMPSSHLNSPGPYANRGPPNRLRPVDIGNSSHPLSSEVQLPPSAVPKHYNSQDNSKYQNPSSHNYPGTQELPSYSSNSSNCHKFPAYVAAQQTSVPAQRDKRYSRYHCQDRSNARHSQYLQQLPQQRQQPHLPVSQPPLPSALNVSENVDIPRAHSNSYSEVNKYASKYSSAENGRMPQSLESQNDDRVDQSQGLWCSPLVVDIDGNSNEPRNTKTYIELDVPKACPREKIVVVDVDKEEKEQAAIRKSDAVKTACCPPSLPSKSTVEPEIIELDVPKPTEKVTGTFEQSKESEAEFDRNNSKDTPDVMFIEMTKKKEPSALIRRARLHGKQRTYRDSENRPLVPYSSVKKSQSPDIPVHYQKSVFQPQVSLPRLVLPKKPDTKIIHGWSWEGKPSEKLVYISNDDPPFLRLCYPAMRHQEGDVIKVRDCVLLKSGARKTDLPFIAKITALWENPVDGEMTMSLLWYYRPEHTEPGRKPFHTEGEIFASKHFDTNSVACIEDKCYVLTFGEYCRYRRHCKMLESTSESPVSVVPPTDDYPRKERLPPSYISPDMVFVCRKVYDFRQKRILKNPM